MLIFTLAIAKSHIIVAVVCIPLVYYQNQDHTFNLVVKLCNYVCVVCLCVLASETAQAIIILEVKSFEV